MARLRFHDVTRDIDLIVFDKDGTLIDFDFTWGARCRAAVDALIADLPARAAIRDRLLGTIGIDPSTGRAIAESPIVVGTVGEVAIVAATLLYQSGEPWTAALLATERHVRGIFAPPPTPDEVRCFPAVAPLFKALSAAGVTIAVLTNDDRAGTVATLTDLGLIDDIALIVCADDGHGGKPEPHGLRHIAQRLAIAPDRVAMVGDAIGDLIVARRAGIALGIGVLSGAALKAALAPYADAIIDHVGAIEILHG